MYRKINMPSDRVAVLIGRRGTVKKEVEKRTHTKISIGQEVSIEGDGLGVLEAENIVKAISRGFTPEQAMQLLREDTTLFVLPLPKSEKTLSRIRARIIGKKGRSRKNIERLTKTSIVVYGRTVSIIGTYEDVEISRGAVEKLIRGERHASVYRYLEGLNVRNKIREKNG